MPLNPVDLLRRLNKAFSPSDENTDFQANASRIMSVFLWVFIIMITLTMLAALLLSPEQPERPLQVILLMDPVCILALVLIRRGKLVLGSGLAVAALWLIVTVMAYTGGGVRAPSFAGYMLVTFLASIVFGGRGIALVAAASGLSGLGMVYLDGIGRLPTSAYQTTPATVWLTIISFMTLISLLQYFSSQVTRRSLARANDELEERNRADQALRESEARYRGVVSALAEGILVYGMDGTIVDYNASAQTILDLPEGSLRGSRSSHPNWHVLHEDGSEFKPEENPTLYTLRTGKPCSNVIMGLNKPDGRMIWLSVNTQPMAKEGEALKGVVASFADITASRVAQLALRESEEKLRLITGTIEDVFWMHTPGITHVLYASPAFEKLWQMPVAQLYLSPRDFLSIIHPDDLAAYKERIDTSDAKGAAYEIEYRILPADGSLRWIRERGFPILGDDGSLRLMTCVCTDITGWRVAQEMQRFQASLLAKVAQAVIATDLSGKVTYWNKFAETLYGWSEAEVLGKQNAQLVAHSISPEQSAQIEEKLNRGEVWVGELPAISKDGRVFPTHVNLTPLLDGQGSPMAVISVAYDVTESRRQEQALRASEEKYRALMESLDNVIISVDQNGVLLYLNELAAQMFGAQASVLQGKSIHDLFPEPAASRYLDLVRQAIRQGRQEVFENQSKVKGQMRWHRTTIQPIYGADGQVMYALVNATDIHDLKTTQQQLEDLNRTLEERVRERTQEVRRSETTYRALFENSNDGIYLFSPFGETVAVNQKGLDILGLSREEFLTHRIGDMIVPGQRQEEYDRFSAVLRGEAVPLYERTYLKAGGEQVEVEVNLSAIREPSGQIILVQSVVRDITLRKQAEETLRRANQEMGSAMRMKDEFLASMSHELRTPLTGILGISEALQMQTYGALNERQLRSVGNIENSGRHLLELINDILDLSKLEAGKLTLEMDWLQLNDVCEASLHLIRAMAQKKSQDVSYAISPPDIMMQGDGRRLKQILVNLLSNAVKYTPQGGRLGLDVNSSESERRVYLSVWDNGIGIKPEDMERLFKPFVQLDSSLAREQAGTGLGLALVNDLVKIHGGTVEVKSVENEGSRFTVALPWVWAKTLKEPQAESLAAVASAALPAQPAVEEGGIKVMIVDDNEINITILADFLASRKMQVFSVNSGYECLDQVAGFVPDVILMDIQMPGIDGLETIRRLRALPDQRIAAVPVVALTALAMVGDREKSIEAGANDYISKPFSLAQVYELVQRLVA